jgi:aerobic C4-dicarboxylate transport protein
LKFFKQLWVLVVIGAVLGVIVGALFPSVAGTPAVIGLGEKLKPLGDAFVALIKMIIAPVIFCTVVAGIAHMNDAKAVGRVGLKAVIYFEAMSTIALIIGLGVGLLIKPGAGFDPASIHIDAKAVADLTGKAQHLSTVDFLMHIIPDTFVSAFTAEGSLLQVLFLAVLVGFGCSRLGSFGQRCAEAMESVSKVFFSVIHILVRAAPIGAFGAMAYTIGKFGLHTLVQLGFLAAAFAITSALFVIIVLGAVCWFSGFSIFKYLRYIREEFMIVLGASSSEAALPQLMEKMERLGADKSVVGLVIPTGYSFNLDGTNIYMTLAILFLAQATHTDLSWTQLGTILLVAMLTSKGASGVTGAGFITLIATVQAVQPSLVPAVGLLLGIDRFMSLVRALTNFIGNGVASIVVAKWEGQLDEAVLQRELIAGPRYAERDEATETNPV